MSPRKSPRGSSSVPATLSVWAGLCSAGRSSGAITSHRAGLNWDGLVELAGGNLLLTLIFT